MGGGWIAGGDHFFIVGGKRGQGFKLGSGHETYVKYIVGDSPRLLYPKLLSVAFLPPVVPG